MVTQNKLVGLETDLCMSPNCTISSSKAFFQAEVKAINTAPLLYLSVLMICKQFVMHYKPVFVEQ